MGDMTDLVIDNVLVGLHARRTRRVTLRNGTVAAIEADPGRPGGGVQVIDGRGGVLIRSLHDHHIHLLATAAMEHSVEVGPGRIRGVDGMRCALAGAPRHDGWVRAVGYHHSVAGDLDRYRLDDLLADVPLRVQDRSGIRWTLNSAAIDQLELDQTDHRSVERDGTGQPTGRVHRGDEWLRQRRGWSSPPHLGPLSARLLAAGVTGVTDATPYDTIEQLDALSNACTSGALNVEVTVTGASELADAAAPPGLRWGPVKVVIDDHDAPSLDELVERFVAAHAAARPVAVHSVTTASLVLAMAAWDVAGARPGDRVEHGSVIPEALIETLANQRLTVVTQPGFVAERGDQYLDEVDPGDIGSLYRCASLLDSGVAVAGGTDAPYGSADPWRAIRAARTRRTANGRALGAAERVGWSRAVALFQGGPLSPGEPPRPVTVGAPADLCLLHPDWQRRQTPVAMTLRGGQIVG